MEEHRLKLLFRQKNSISIKTLKTSVSEPNGHLKPIRNELRKTRNLIKNVDR